MKRMLAAATALGLVACPLSLVGQTRNLDAAYQAKDPSQAPKVFENTGAKYYAVSTTGAKPNLTAGTLRGAGTSVKKPGGPPTVPPVPEAKPVDSKKDKDKGKTKTKAEEAPSDPKAVLGAAMFGLGGALIGFALGGPIGACAGFMIGAFVGALAAKLHTYAEETAKAKK